MSATVTIVETPRDAFQGLPRIIPTEEKVGYIHTLIDAGFKHIDLGSFVSAQAVPQMADSRQVVDSFRNCSSVEKIAIIVNDKGLDRALEVGGLDALGFPFSLSEHFQLQNTKTSTSQTWPIVERIISLTEQHDMSFILYLSMAFGNPYGERWDEDSLLALIHSLSSLGVRHISLADTVAAAIPEQVERVFHRAVSEHPKIEFGVHLHGSPESWYDNVQAALEAGCRRFDAAAGGLGGCPFAQDALVANIPSDKLVENLEASGFKTGVDIKKVKECGRLAQELQRKYGASK